MKTDCQCEKCKKCCWNSPGWFGSIEEVEGAAKIMGMPLKDFAQEYLIREWWESEDDISIPAPRKNFDKYTGLQKLSELFTIQMEMSRNGKGFVKASWGHNLMSGWACIFLDDNEMCLIHESKPLECKKAFGCEKQSTRIVREKLPDYWKKHQDWIEKLV